MKSGRKTPPKIRSDIKSALDKGWSWFDKACALCRIHNVFLDQQFKKEILELLIKDYFSQFAKSPDIINQFFVQSKKFDDLDDSIPIRQFKKLWHKLEVFELIKQHRVDEVFNKIREGMIDVNTTNNKGYTILDVFQANPVSHVFHQEQYENVLIKMGARKSPVSFKLQSVLNGGKRNIRSSAYSSFSNYESYEESLKQQIVNESYHPSR